MKRDSRRDTNRHRKRNRRRDDAETGKDKSMVRNNRRREKRKPKTQRKKGRGQLLNLLVPPMLIRSGLWTDMESDEDGGIHASDGASKAEALCAPVKQSKNTRCARGGLIRRIKARLIYMLRI